jgi:hypothetical protein
VVAQPFATAHAIVSAKKKKCSSFFEENKFKLFIVLRLPVTATAFISKHLKLSKPREKNLLYVFQAWISFSDLDRAESLFYLRLNINLQ